ncbi:hypothetical protein BO70DRAFT_387135 [Aspergillus heteromorphus CBS 117.55]|uniref:Uncharacterized protein n=1 Tax=Aspergillus heteromorphus CBS 117.55 TaxID=1448321 RepID=A0A317WCA1_9EURO|nr:uncharacterized protein BO70DRAFT_387135 [Aspergillus heteromorphus CBS 117.55]PWY82997.1 hypothetical protein BO70DRAFT_387135 [Aspergillus heteromorphus CBS 117.55]
MAGSLPPAKLESYVSPPLSPLAHWSFDLDPVRRGMDGEIRRMKQHDPHAPFAARSGMSRRAADRFRQAGAPATRGDPSQATGRPRMSGYLDYGYTDAPFQGGPLQGDELQPYPPTLRDQQRQHQSVHQPLAPYDSEMVYNLSQQGPAQAPYEVVPPYPSRQSAAMEALSSHFGVPQYFPPNEPTGTAMESPYLSSPIPLAVYNHPGAIGRSSATQVFPPAMSDLTSVGAPSQPPPQSLPQPSRAESEAASMKESYAWFQRVLREAFDRTRAGRLVEASRSLLEISEWLVTNARELGILRDDQVMHSDRLQIWNDFNICWLAVCQKQKDLAQELLQTGRQPAQTSLLSGDAMDNLGKELIQFCDRMEPHGLVDYQMGIWEEEILSVLGQCLDLIEGRPDVFRTAGSR